MGGRDRIQNVRIADPVAGKDGLRVDRMISSLKESESQCRIMTGSTLDFSTPTTADALGSFGFDEIFASDDFSTMIQQWNLFRVSAIKFDIYDINPTVAVNNTWGVWHDNYEGAVPAYTRQNMVDLPDSRVLSSGTGQTTLYWVPHGTAEQQFQAASSSGSAVQKYGGLRYFVAQNAVNVPKYVVVVHAVVDFRGRR
jgi:hypothetical protein